jgi:hypothetical protein
LGEFTEKNNRLAFSLCHSYCLIALKSLQTLLMIRHALILSIAQAQPFNYIKIGKGIAFIKEKATAELINGILLLYYCCIE